jgi:tRNA(Ile)-lysidine synthase
MSIRDTVEKPIIEAWSPDCWCDVTTLVAVSGGPDSVALLRAMLAVRRPGAGRLIVAHFNHGLRGRESDDEEQFVQELSRRLGLPCHVGRAAPATDSDGWTSEEAARRTRYAFLSDVAAQRGARYVATGHTADDQAETVLHRILRGTGIGGLSGIRSHRQLLHGVSLVRPLLGVRRSSLLEYLAVLGQDYCQDSSNQSREFTRNRLRNDLIPRLESDYNAQLIPALGRLAILADEVQQWLDQQTTELMATCVELNDDGQEAVVVVDCRGLPAVRALLVRELFVAIWKQRAWPRQAMGFDKWDELAQLARSSMGDNEHRTLVLPGGLFAQRIGSRLTLQRSGEGMHNV